MSAYARQLVTLAAFGVLTLIILVVLLRSSGAHMPGTDAYDVAVVVPDAANLAAKADVRVGGVKVGSVEQVRLTGSNAVAKIRLDAGASRLSTNARVRLRYKSTLNEGYLDLFPGGGRGTTVIPDGGSLPLSHADETVQIDEVLSTFDARARKSVRRVLDGSAPLLEHRGDDVNETLGALNDTVQRGRTTFGVLAPRRREIAMLTDHLGEVSAALGARHTAVRTLVRRARDAAEAVDREDAGLRALLKEVPPTLGQAGATARDLGGLARSTTPVVGRLAGALGGLAPSVRRLPAVASATRRAVSALDTLNPRATALLRELRPFATAASGLMPPLDGVLRQLNPLSSYLSSQRRNLAAFFSNYAASTDATDSAGHLNELSFLFNRETIQAALPPEGERVVDALEAAGILTQISGRIDFNPYPADGAIADPRPFSGRYPRLQPEPSALPGAP